MANGLFNLKQVVQAVQQGGWPAQKTPAVEYLVVSGGGGGGLNGGAGGGGGGLLAGVDPVPNGQTLLVTVGSGGAAGSGGGPGGVGGNSVFGAIASTGGGGGGYGAAPANAGVSGGSGGGSASYDNVSRAGAQGIAGQGNKGGDSVSLGANQFSSSGGGGAGTAGLSPVTGVGGNGGAGIASDISGTRTAYAGGGAGGGNSYPSNYGNGGAGGGGGASTSTNGTANTGGGGANGIGGSGIVIVSYPDVYAAPTATTGSPTVSTSGSGSISFNGSTQFVAYPSNAAFNLGSSNFTIEFWVYRSASGTQVFAGQNNSSLGARVFDIGIDGSNNFNGEVYVGATSYTVSSSTTMNISTWYHVALVRNSTVLTLYVNGTSVGTITVAGSVTAGSTPITVGRVGDYSSAYYLNGYVSNFRYVVGTALYTGNFTPSTTPLTAVSGTQLLLNSVSGAYLADGSTNSFAPASTTVAGGWNQLSPFTGTGYKNRVYTWTSSGSITF